LIIGSQARNLLSGSACDPMINELPRDLKPYGNVRFCESASKSITEADVVVVLVDHDVYRGYTNHRLAGRALYDTRGVWR